MTWADYINSSYNTDGFYADGTYLMSSGFGSVLYNGVEVMINDYIVPNGYYYFFA